MSTSVYVILINYKSEEIIKQAINSIQDDHIDLKIFILDNESTKESLFNLKTLVNKKIEIISSKINLGFAGGVNYVFEYINKKHENIDYLFLLNPDATIERNSISRLVNTMNQFEDVAAVSPKILNDKGENWFTGTTIDWINCKIINNPISDNQETKEIDVFNGCSVLFDAKKFKESGMFDTDTFLYYDEAFLSQEFRKRNYRIIYNSNIINHHSVSYSVGYNSPLKHYYMTRNHLYFFNKYKKESTFCKYKIPLKNTFWYLKHLNINGFTAGIIAIKDYLIQKKGKK